jgi:hypothetical protein
MPENINNIRRDIQEYLEVQFDLFRLQTAESLARILSSTLKIAMLGFLLFFILLFLSFATGYFLASQLQSNELGFLCVAGFYGLILVIFTVFKKWLIERPIIKAIMKLLFPKSGGNDE